MSNYNHPREIGPFPGVVQIVAPFGSENHELLTNPQRNGAAGGDLINHGGPTVVGGRAFNIYLGQAQADPQLDAFARAACASFYLSPDGVDSSPSQFLGSLALPQNPLPMTVDDTQISAWVDQAVANGTLPADDGKTMYFLMMPVGSTVSIQASTGPAHSCTDFCGYHSASPQGHLYLVICDNSCPGCNGGLPAILAKMMIWVHEYVETRSDPLGTTWFDGQGAENGDKCAWQEFVWGQFEVQPEWVNGRNCYVPPFNNPPPPPPPPPPVDKTVALVMTVQPVSVKVGDPSTGFQVSLVKADGTVNTSDTSQVTAVLNGFPTNSKTVAAVSGVATFPAGVVTGFQNAHTGLWWNVSASGLPTIHSGLFDVTAGPPPPPPPTPKTYEEGYADGYAAAKAKAVAVVEAL